MSYRRLLLAALFSNTALLAFVGLLVVVVPGLAERLAVDRGLRLMFLIAVLLLQALWSRWYFITVVPFRFRVVDLAALLFASDFFVLFCLTPLPLDPAGFLLLAALLASPVWAYAMRLQVRACGSRLTLIGRRRDYQLTARQIHPLRQNKELRQRAEQAWERL